MKANKENIHPSSFRDPSGYIFKKNDQIYRKINSTYFNTYDFFIESGLYQKLIEEQLLIAHTEIEKTDSFLIIKPEQIPFITYSNEWSFDQIKDASLLTLKIQKIALQYGMTLKDATAFNVTFYKNRPIFIDSLSFEIYKENTPWHAYSQFISHFLGPIVLSQSIGCDFLKTLSFYIDGIALMDIWKMLPFKKKMNLFMYSNICLPAQFVQKYNNDNTSDKKQGFLSKKTLENIIINLYDNIQNLKINQKTQWSDYYCLDAHDKKYFNKKTEVIKNWVKNNNIKKAWDVGGNNGEIAQSLKHLVASLIVSDIDPIAVNTNYLNLQKTKDENILAIVSDFLNPTPNRGFALKERISFFDRINSYKPDLVLALALLHHISLTGNIPFYNSAKLFHSFSDLLIIEFIHRDDPRVTGLLKSKREFEHLFDFYNMENFEKEYSQLFSIKEKVQVANTRTLYLLQKKGQQ